MYTSNPTSAYLWYVLFEDDTFMPIIYSVNKNQSEQDAIAQLVAHYETHLELCVDIEPSDLEITKKNVFYIKCVIGRVYANTSITKFKSETLEFLLNYKLVSVYNLTVETKITHPSPHWTMVPYYIPTKYTKMYSSMYDKITSNITCGSKYEAFTETIPHYLSVNGIHFPNDGKVDNKNEYCITADIDDVKYKKPIQLSGGGVVFDMRPSSNTPRDVPNTHNVQAYSTEIYANTRWGVDFNQFNSATPIKCEKTSVIYAFKNVMYVKTLSGEPGDTTTANLRNVFETMHAPAIYEYISADERIHAHIKSSFDKKDVLDKHVLNTKFANLEKYISLCAIDAVENDKKTDAENVKVKEYINQRYEITNDINERMKATELFNDIMCYSQVSVDEHEKLSFRNRLSGYLKELNVAKKRFSDGFYYYGLKRKRTLGLESYSDLLNRQPVSIPTPSSISFNSIDATTNNLLQSEYQTELDMGQSMKNANFQLRPEPIIPKNNNISPCNLSTIEHAVELNEYSATGNHVPMLHLFGDSEYIAYA